MNETKNIKLNIIKEISYYVGLLNIDMVRDVNLRQQLRSWSH